MGVIFYLIMSHDEFYDIRGFVGRRLQLNSALGILYDGVTIGHCRC